MSQHVIKSSDGIFKFVFGWDQPLMSFYLQVHDLDLPEEANPVVWVGTGDSSVLYEVEDLVRIAKKEGLDINTETQSLLFSEKDNGL